MARRPGRCRLEGRAAHVNPVGLVQPERLQLRQRARLDPAASGLSNDWPRKRLTAGIKKVAATLEKLTDRFPRLGRERRSVTPHEHRARPQRVGQFSSGRSGASAGHRTERQGVHVRKPRLVERDDLPRFGRPAGGLPREIEVTAERKRHARGPRCREERPARDAAHLTISSPRSRMSFDDAPIMTRNAPGSTTHLLLAIEHPQLLRSEPEADLARSAAIQREALKAFQLDDRPRHRREQIADVELHDLVAGARAGVSHRAPHHRGSGGVNRRRLDAQVRILERRVTQSEPEREQRHAR